MRVVEVAVQGAEFWDLVVADRRLAGAFMTRKLETERYETRYAPGSRKG